MVPDFIIRGQWVDWFLIYWASCIFLYFLITWIALKIHPLYYDWSAYPTIISRSLWLPILLPLRVYAAWRGRQWMKKQEKEHSEFMTKPEGPIVRPMEPIPFAPPMPPPIADGDEFSEELVEAWESYMERLGEIEVERHHKDQSRLEDRGAPTSV